MWIVFTFEAIAKMKLSTLWNIVSVYVACALIECTHIVHYYYHWLNCAVHNPPEPHCSIETRFKKIHSNVDWSLIPPIQWNIFCNKSNKRYKWNDRFIHMYTRKKYDVMNSSTDPSPKEKITKPNKTKEAKKQKANP